MAPYMSDSTPVNGIDHAEEEIKPSGIRVVIVGAGFAGITAAIECSTSQLSQTQLSRSHNFNSHVT